MDFEELLKGRDCSCGKFHSCEIEKVIIKSGAINEIAKLTDGYNNILIVADKNTYATCGETVKKQLEGKCENILIFQQDTILVPDEVAIEKAQSYLTDNTDLIVGIGSGVIQDLCKYVSFYKKLDYYIVATAPSMDGYASKGAAMITGNMKVTYNTHVPKVIIGDIDILKNAPLDMIKSGYGDILGKFSCLNDWLLSRAVNDEYFCQYVYDLTYDMLLKTKDLGQKLINRDDESIKTLMEALVGVGIAMAYAGNSRPASGSEHHLSHFFEVTGIMENKPYFLHGIDVVYSAVVTQYLRQKLIELDMPNKCFKHTVDIYKQKIKDIYTHAAEGVLELQNRLGWYDEDKTTIYNEKWEEIKKILDDAPKTDEMFEYLQTVELDINEFKNMYGEEKIKNAIYYAKDLKDRYSVLWLYYHMFAEE